MPRKPPSVVSVQMAGGDATRDAKRGGSSCRTREDLSRRLRAMEATVEGFAGETEGVRAQLVGRLDDHDGRLRRLQGEVERAGEVAPASEALAGRLGAVEESLAEARRAEGGAVEELRSWQGRAEEDMRALVSQQCGVLASRIAGLEAGHEQLEVECRGLRAQLAASEGLSEEQRRRFAVELKQVARDAAVEQVRESLQGVETQIAAAQSQLQRAKLDMQEFAHNAPRSEPNDGVEWARVAEVRRDVGQLQARVAELEQWRLSKLQHAHESATRVADGAASRAPPAPAVRSAASEGSGPAMSAHVEVLRWLTWVQDLQDKC